MVAQRPREWHRSLARGAVFTRCLARSDLARRRRQPVARPTPRKETAVNDLLYPVAVALGSTSAFDDVVTGVAGVVFRVGSAAPCGVVFARTI
jgi:hypothetical protein